IFGSAVCSRTPAGDAHNTPRFQAQVELKSVGAHQGYVSEWASAEAALNATDARSATEFAFRDAAFKIQRHLLAAAILTAYTQERRAGILLSVDEVPGTGWADQLRRAVAAVPGVGRVEVLRAKAGTCRYELQIEGHIADVAKSIGAIELG